ncbi:MAG: PilZ domain-containing protein [Terriglobia bacterium]
MEGPNLLRSSPRTLLCCPVELRVGEKTIRLEQAIGNLSAGGLFVNAEALPLNTAVHVKIAAKPPFKAKGVVRFCDAGGVGIEFTSLTPPNRQRLEELIAEFTHRETLAS